MKLKLSLSQKQTEAIHALTQRKEVREVTFGGAKNGGKSFLGISWLAPSALMYPGTYYFIARKELVDLRKFTTPTIYEWFHVNGMNFADHCIQNVADSVFNFRNGSKIFMLSCDYRPGDPLFERFGSMQMTQGWIEEGGEIPASAYENLKLAIGRWKNDEYKLPAKLLITCNPKKNWLYTEFYKPSKEGTLPASKVFIQSLVTDNAFRQSGAIEVLDGIKDPITKARLRYGEWEYSGDPAELVDHEAIMNIFTNAHVRDEKANKYITADIARFGSDSSIIRLWRGWEVLQRWEIRKERVTMVASKIKEIATLHKIPMSRVCVDEDGVGGGVQDILLCKGFVANSSAIKTGYQNNQNFDSLKSQCGYYLADKINQSGVFEPSLDSQLKARLSEELSQLKMKSVDTDGKRGLMPKDMIKSFIGRSPDDLDTYIMRVTFDLQVYGPSFITPSSVVSSHNGRNEFNM